MWKDDRKKRIILNILLVFVILVIVAGLGSAMLYVRRQTEAHDEELSVIYVQQQQKQTEARQESLDTIQAEYDKDMATVAEYLPGIVCWGDSLTLGSSGNRAYPSVLKTYLDTYFCDIYDFRSTILNADEYSRLKWDDYKVKIPVINMGAGPEDSYTILGRAGALPYVTGEDLTIPAQMERVGIKLQSENGSPVYPLTGGNAGVNNVLIGGVEGTIAIDSSAYSYDSYQYFFTRNEPGQEAYIPAGTVIKTAATDQYRDYIHVVCIGTYGTFTNADELVQQTKTLLSRQAKNPDRFIVLGLCSVDKSTYNTYSLDVIDTAMMQAFGNRYINVRKYLVEDGLADAGIKPTSDDELRMPQGMVPNSFLSTSHGIELNGKAYTLIGKLVYDRMESLGYFDEVYDELGIRETTLQILKEDPKYFEGIIGNALQ